MNKERASRRAGWRLIASTIRPQQRWVWTGLVTSLGWTAAKVAVPLLAALAIDKGIIDHDNGVVVRVTIALLLVGLFQAICSAFRRYCAFRIGYRAEADLRMRLVVHLQRLHFGFHDESQTGQLMARANTDIQQITNVTTMIPLTMAFSFIIVGVAVVLFAQNVTLALIALAPMPFTAFAAIRFSTKMQPLGSALQQELAQLSGVVEQTVSGVRVVKGFGAEQMQIKRLEDEARNVYERAIAMARLRGRFLPIVDFLPQLALVSVLFYGGHLVLDGSLQVGNLIAFNSLVLMIVWPLRMLGMLLAQWPRAVAAAERIREVLVTEPEIVDRAGARALPPGPGDIKFDAVCFGYGPGAQVLDKLDLVLRGGEAVALVGATGEGKSTVARLLPRFYEVDEGRILLDGVDIRDLRLADLRQAIGLVFEDTFLFTDTVRANIAFANADATQEQVVRAAQLAGAREFIEALPDQYETLIGEHGFSLSGGQRQRIAIARAVLADPRVLILDDATSSVDPAKEHEIRGALLEVMHGRTTLIIAHRPATIALADRVVLLDDGRVVADGTHVDLLRTNTRYRQVLARAEVKQAELTTEPSVADRASEPGPDRDQDAVDGAHSGATAEEVA